jgi:hypothetical protein
LTGELCGPWPVPPSPQAGEVSPRIRRHDRPVVDGRRRSALVSAILNLVFISAYPVWSTILIAIDVIVIYAIVVHGRELKSTS